MTDDQNVSIEHFTIASEILRNHLDPDVHAAIIEIASAARISPWQVVNQVFKEHMQDGQTTDEVR